MAPCPSLETIDFLVYSRVASSTADVERDQALHEEHWAYMDRFADGMTARGPTFAADRATWTGSLHIVDLPSVGAARHFVEAEPYNRAGLFESHLIRRFEDLLGRTMWEFARRSDEPIFLVLAQMPAEDCEHPSSALPTDLTGLPPERLIVHGALLTAELDTPVGVAVALQAPARDAVEALVGSGRARFGDELDVQIHDWEFGGRR